MKYLILLLTAVVALPSAAAHIEFGHGVEVLVANVEPIEDNQLQLQVGDNQLVVKFTGNIRKGSKRERVETRPQIITLAQLSDQQVVIRFAAKTINQLNTLYDNKQPLFEVLINGTIVDVKQSELPPAKGFLPYRNPLKLVKEYNIKHGLVFDSGKIRHLKDELAQVNLEQQAKQGQTEQQKAQLSQESETSLQLKIWYSRANAKEKAAFKQWIETQN